MAAQGHLTLRAERWVLDYRLASDEDDWHASVDLAISFWEDERRMRNPEADAYLLVLSKARQIAHR